MTESGIPWPTRWDSVVLCIVVIVLYVPTIQYDLVWDDVSLVRENELLEPEHVALVWSSPFWKTSLRQPPEGETGYLRPVVISTFLLEKTLFGTTSGLPYHATNIVLYIGGCLLVLALFRALKLDRTWAFAGALIFAAHPMHVESVAFVSGRTDLLAGFFLLVAALIYSRTEQTLRWPALLGIGVSYSLALLSKEIGLVLPGLLFIIDVWHHNLTPSRVFRMRRPMYVLLLGVTLGYVAYRYGVLGSFLTSSRTAEAVMINKVILVLHSLSEYLLLSVFPFIHNSLYHLADLKNGLGATFLKSLVIILGLTGGVFLLKPSRLRWLGLSWFLILLLPVSNLHATPSAYIAERFLYVPLAGLALLLVLAFQRITMAKQWVGIALLAMFVLACGIDTANRNSMWTNNWTVFSQIMKESPNAPQPYEGLGLEYLKRGKADSAAMALSQAIRLGSTRGMTQAHYGWALIELGRYQEAVNILLPAVQKDPASVPLAVNLMEAYLGLGRIDLADSMSRILSPQYPSDPNILFSVGKVWAKQGLRSNAVLNFLRVREIDPGSTKALKALIHLYLDPPVPDSMMKYAQQLVQLDPSDPDGWNGVGASKLLKGEFTEAIEPLKRARSIAPDNYAVFVNLSILYEQSGRIDEARSLHEGWIRDLPNHPMTPEVRRYLTQNLEKQ